MKGNNKMSNEQFIASFGHPRRQELATMVLDGASFEELKAAGYGRIQITEMINYISAEVEGKEEFVSEMKEFTDAMKAAEVEPVAEEVETEEVEEASAQLVGNEPTENNAPVEGAAIAGVVSENETENNAPVEGAEINVDPATPGADETVEVVTDAPQA